MPPSDPASPAGIPWRAARAAGARYASAVRPPSSHTSTFSGRSSAASGTASITGVPARGLPNSTTRVGRRSSPAPRAAPSWSTTAKRVSPRSAISASRRATVSPTESGLVVLTSSSR
jgi:hypothetical protein